MIILGIDPGTRYCGYAILKKEKQKIDLIESGCLNVHKLTLKIDKNADKSGLLIDKVGIIYDFFHEKVLQYEITNLAIETPFMYKNAGTFLKLGYVRGIIYLISYKTTLKLSEYSPSEVKLAATGYGKASKEQVANVIMKLFKIKKPQRDDITDAIAVALCGAWRT